MVVLISGQLQVSRWQFPVSVPFANFSSQGRHKTQSVPAAVHRNPFWTMSHYLTWLDKEMFSLSIGGSPTQRKRLQRE